MPKALLAAALLFVLCEHALWSWPWLLRYASRQLEPGPHADPLRVHARAATYAGAPPLALFGSSQVRFGLECDVLTAFDGAPPCLSLATDGGSPADMLYVASELDRTAPRRLTLAAITPAPLWQPLRPHFTGRGALGAIAVSRAFADLRASAWNDVLLASALHASPTLRFREGLLPLASLFWRYPKLAWKGKMNPATEVPPDQPDRAWPDPATLVPRAEEDVASRRLQTEALVRFLDHERALGNRVIVVDIPASPEYEAAVPDYVRRGFGWAMELVRARPEVRLVLRDEIPSFVHADFRDPVHLGQSGRRKLSLALRKLVLEPR